MDSGVAPDNNFHAYAIQMNDDGLTGLTDVAFFIDAVASS